MQSILAGQSLQVFLSEKKQNVVCVSLGLFGRSGIWGVGCVTLPVPLPACADALGHWWELYTWLSMAVELPNELIKCVQTPWGKLPGPTASEAPVKIVSTPRFSNWSPRLSGGPQVSARWPSSSSHSPTWTLPHCHHPTQHSEVNSCSWLRYSSHGPSDREPPWDDLSADTPKHHGFSATTWHAHPRRRSALTPRLYKSLAHCGWLGGSSKDN